MHYQKINSLYKREGHDFATSGIRPKNGKLLMGQYARPEFESITRWSFEEKIDGMNIVVTYANGLLSFGGRTNKTIIPPALLSRLEQLFSVDKIIAQFPTCSHVMLFGEGYGGKIQAGGYYSKEPDFFLFDVFAGGWWIDKEAVVKIADAMGLRSKILQNTLTFPLIATIQEIVEFVGNRPDSGLAYENTRKLHEMEGIIARAYPMMLFRDGTPVMFKLKCKDLYGSSCRASEIEEVEREDKRSKVV